MLNSFLLCESSQFEGLFPNQFYRLLIETTTKSLLPLHDLIHTLMSLVQFFIKFTHKARKNTVQLYEMLNFAL